jgi:hypothetical protein
MDRAAVEWVLLAALGAGWEARPSSGDQVVLVLSTPGATLGPARAMVVLDRGALGWVPTIYPERERYPRRLRAFTGDELGELGRQIFATLRPEPRHATE